MSARETRDIFRPVVGTSQLAWPVELRSLIAGDVGQEFFPVVDVVVAADIDDDAVDGDNELALVTQG